MKGRDDGRGRRIWADRRGSLGLIMRFTAPHLRVFFALP